MWEKQLAKTIWAYRYLPLGRDDTKDYWYLVDVSNQIDFEPRFETLETLEEYFRKLVKGNVKNT